MAFKPRKDCKSCQVILQEGNGFDGYKKSDLFKQVSNYQKGIGQLLAIANSDKYKEIISYQGLVNHAKKHQAASEGELVKAKVRKSTNQLKHEAAEAEVELTKKKLHHTDRREKFLDWLMDEMEKGTIKPTASAIAAGLKQEADIEAKQTDQGIEMAKLMNSYLANPLPPASVDKLYIEGEIVE